jgi:hypothetical protein
MNLTFVAGDNSEIGKAYIAFLAKYVSASSSMPVKVIGLSRTRQEKSRHFHVTADLADAKLTHRVIDDLVTIYKPHINQISIIHCVGDFLFEGQGVADDYDNDGINDNVRKSNVDTLINLYLPLLAHAVRQKLPISVIVFGSVSDKFHVPYWQSFTGSKDILRKFLAEQPYDKLHVLFANLATVNTFQERALRPYADTHYWLTPEQVVNDTIWHWRFPAKKWIEPDVYVPNPAYNADFFKPQVVMQRWTKEMGVKK